MLVLLIETTGKYINKNLLNNIECLMELDFNELVLYKMYNHQMYRNTKFPKQRKNIVCGGENFSQSKRQQERKKECREDGIKIK